MTTMEATPPSQGQPPRPGQPAVSPAGRKPTTRERVRYRFDTSLSRGPVALIGWLLVGAAVLGVVAGLVAYFLLTPDEGDNFLDTAWTSIIGMLGPIRGAPGWPARLFYVVVGLIGVAVGASLIGLLASALGQRIAALNEGRSRVLERGHTLILGWSPRLPTIVEELLIANENLTRPAIVILAPRPTTEMEREIRDEAGDLKNTRIVCRSGDPGKPADLELANIGSARSVIILAGEDGDTDAVKAVLAVKSLNPNLSRTRVVAELNNPENAESIRSLSEGRVNTVNSNEVIAQVTAQACYQTGLSTVFRELLSFEGNECYFAEVPTLVGHTYAEALLAFNTSSPIGWCKADGTVELNPPPGAVFGPGDRVIAVSRDDDTVTFSGFRDEAVKAPKVGAATGANPVKLLIVGWSEFGPRVLDELEEFLAPGSDIEVCVDADLVNPEEIRRARPELAVSLVSGGADDLRSLSGREFDRVIVLGYTKGLSRSQADARPCSLCSPCARCGPWAGSLAFGSSHSSSTRRTSRWPPPRASTTSS